VGANSYRQYAFKDLLKLNYVRVLRALDFSLEDIAAFIGERDLIGQDRMLVDKQLERRIKELERICDRSYYRSAVYEGKQLRGQR